MLVVADCVLKERKNMRSRLIENVSCSGFFLNLSLSIE